MTLATNGCKMKHSVAGSFAGFEISADSSAPTSGLEGRMDDATEGEALVITIQTRRLSSQMADASRRFRLATRIRLELEASSQRVPHNVEVIRAAAQQGVLLTVADVEGVIVFAARHRRPRAMTA
ncbi:hypothetical protein [Microbacterium maritypicum]|nr:hypothetical protein [Microbacterium liquefaciens]